MPYTLPVEGDGLANGKPWAAPVLAAINGLDVRVASVESASTSGFPGYVLLTSFAGADSTAKMRTALAALAVEPSGTRRALVVPSGTTLAPGTTPFQLSNGIAIVGGFLPTTEFSYQARVTISGAAVNGVFQLKKNGATNPETGTANPASGTQTRGVIIAGIAWEGPGSSVTCDFFQRNFTEQLTYSTFDNLSFDNFSAVLHQRFLGFMWTGGGYCNNSNETPFRFSGSDWKVFRDGYYLDSPNLASTKYLIEVVSGNKAHIGSVFVTGNGPTPVLVSGGQYVVLDGLEMEALDNGIGTFGTGATATAGAQLRVDGGNVQVNNPWFFRGMANPGATGRTDNGVMHVAGGTVRVMFPSFGQYDSTETHTENHVYCSGGSVTLVEPVVWNLQGSSGTGFRSVRTLRTATSGSGTISITSGGASPALPSPLQTSLSVIDYGATGDGVTDDRAAIQAALDAASAASIPEIFLPRGTYYINSATDGTNAYGLTVPPGVSVRGAGSGSTIFKMGSTITANLFMVRSTVTAAIATITANAAVGATAFTVDDSSAFAVGDTVETRITQNGSDPAEARMTVFAKIAAIPDATHITIDTPAEWALDVVTSASVNRKLTKVSAIAEHMKFSGFHIVGSSTFRHGIGVQWGRMLTFSDLTGVNVGSGIINAQWCDNCSARDIYVYSCASFSNTSKGRGISLSNVRNFVIDNFSTDYLDSATLYVESYSIGVRANGVRISDRSTTRSTQYLLFTGYDCDAFYDGLTVTGYNPASIGYDSIMSYGSGPGQAVFNDTTLYMSIASVRAFPISSATGFLRVFDTTGVLRTFNLNKLEKSTLVIDLTITGTQTKWLRDGLHVGYEVYVSPGVTSAMLTALNIGRTTGSSVVATWTTGQLRRADTYIGSVIYPMQSAHDKATKITATVAVGSGIPAGSKAIVTVYTVAYNGAVTIGNEPGSEQSDRFLPSST